MRFTAYYGGHREKRCAFFQAAVYIPQGIISKPKTMCRQEDLTVVMIF